MRAIEITQPGGPDVLKPAARPTPAPRENEILVKVAAAGVNRPDVLQRMGSLSDLVDKIPGVADAMPEGAKIDENELVKIKAIVPWVSFDRILE